MNTRTATMLAVGAYFTALGTGMAINHFSSGNKKLGDAPDPKPGGPFGDEPTTPDAPVSPGGRPPAYAIQKPKDLLALDGAEAAISFSSVVHTGINECNGGIDHFVFNPFDARPLKATNAFDAQKAAAKMSHNLPEDELFGIVQASDGYWLVDLDKKHTMTKPHDHGDFDTRSWVRTTKRLVGIASNDFVRPFEEK